MYAIGPYMCRLSTLLVLMIAALCAIAQRPLYASDLQWQSIFGNRPGSEDTVYCLLGRGFFRAERSDNVDSLITSWMKGHPDAHIFPVTVTGPTMVDQPDSRMIYCWVVDREDHLNVFLIRNGGYPGGTMERPETWDELPQWEKDLYPEEEKGIGAIVLVDSSAYASFIEHIKEAERTAASEKLGVWKDQNSDPDR